MNRQHVRRGTKSPLREHDLHAKAGFIALYRATGEQRRGRALVPSLFGEKPVTFFHSSSVKVARF